MHDRVIPEGRSRLTLLALVLASGISVGLLLARAAVTGKLQFAFLPWNLLLAWIPLVFAVLVYRLRLRRSKDRLFLLGCALIWFFFYPNAPYLITDLVHLKTRPPIPRWFDLLLMMSFAWTGLFLGYLSLYLMQEVVRGWRGRAAGWYFALAMLALGAFGIYLGRFLRWNSWDVVVRPLGLLGDVARRVKFANHPEMVAFSLTFFAFSVLIYVTLYTLTHLHGHLDPRDEEFGKTRLPS